MIDNKLLSNMKINSIKIEKLYGKYDFYWNLHENVNILAGDNGSYKTTLLKILASMCEPDNLSDYLNVKSVLVKMTDGVVVKYRSFHDSLLRLKKESETDELLKELVAKVSTDLKTGEDKSLADLTLNASIIALRKANAKISTTEYKKARKYNLIATFDVPSKSDKGSALDQQLESLESDYAYYLSDLSKQLSEIIMKAGKVDMSDMKKIYAQNELFIEIVNKAFASTGKVVNTEQSKLEFKIGEDVLENNKRLSSGEKQFLIVMLTVLLQREEESILIMDEPEISMHLDWQRSLLSNIKVLNPQCQIILATHSPGVIMDGWQQLVTNIENLKL